MEQSRKSCLFIRHSPEINGREETWNIERHSPEVNGREETWNITRAIGADAGEARRQEGKERERLHQPVQHFLKF